MLHYSKEVVNNLGANISQDKGWCKYNWALVRDSLLKKHMGIIGSSHSIVSNEIDHKSSVMDVGNWVISGVNSQGSKQAYLILMV